MEQHQICTYTNQPDEFLTLVRQAKTGADLVALDRPGDIRRRRIMGRYAPLRAIDHDFLNRVAGDYVLAFALLQNENLPLIDPELLASFSMKLLSVWVGLDRYKEAVAYVISLADAAPALSAYLTSRIKAAFQNRQLRRNTREGSAASEVYLALEDNPDRSFMQWLISKTGSQEGAQIGAFYHPTADKQIWLHALPVFEKHEIANTAAWQDPDVRLAYYFRLSTFRKRAEALAQEEDEGVLRKALDFLTAWERHHLLELFVQAGRPLSKETIAIFLQSDLPQTRELVLTKVLPQINNDLRSVNCSTHVAADLTPQPYRSR